MFSPASGPSLAHSRLATRATPTTAREPVTAIATGPQEELEPADTVTIVAMPLRDNDRWELTGHYFETEWSEVLGPTATLLARRLGRIVEGASPATVSLARIGGALGIAPGKVRDSLARLSRHAIVSFNEPAGVLHVSRSAPPVPPDQAQRDTDRTTQG